MLPYPFYKLISLCLCTALLSACGPGNTPEQEAAIMNEANARIQEAAEANAIIMTGRHKQPPKATSETEAAPASPTSAGY